VRATARVSVTGDSAPKSPRRCRSDQAIGAKNAPTSRPGTTVVHGAENAAATSDGPSRAPSTSTVSSAKRRAAPHQLRERRDRRHVAFAVGTGEQDLAPHRADHGEHAESGQRGDRREQQPRAAGGQEAADADHQRERQGREQHQRRHVLVHLVLQRIGEVVEQPGFPGRTFLARPGPGIAGCRRREMLHGSGPMAGRRSGGGVGVDQAAAGEPRAQREPRGVVLDAAQAPHGFVAVTEHEADLGQFSPDFVGIEAALDGAMEIRITLLRALRRWCGMTLELHERLLGWCPGIGHCGSP
jgi:hypothetical protein